MFTKNGLRDLLSVLLLATVLPFAPPAHSQSTPQVCDVDADGDIDKADIRLISDARGQAATGLTDPRDPDRDLLITSADARTCTLRCTLSACAAPGNRAPIASAGPDQAVYTGVQVTLDGSKSTDPDGDLLAYKWTIKRQPVGSAITLTGAATVSPTFKPSIDGEYELQLIVNDKQVDSSPDTVIITTSNAAPIANAGPDQDVIVGTLVKLDGSASSDINGDPLNFSWSFDSRPAGSNATLSSATAVMPTFTPDVAGTYRLKLLVNDGKVDSLPDSVEIKTGSLANIAPIADAGADQAVDLGATVQLDGSGSSDPDNGPGALTYSWSLIGRPSGSVASISSASAVAPTFKADKAGEYVAQLIVNDGAASSAADTVRISTRNTKPVADAGDDQTGDVGITVNLDGRGSFDADGDPLSYLWSFTSRPAGSAASIVNAQQPLSNFIPDKAGLYVAQLVVDDGKVASDPDTATITIAVPALPGITINDVSIAEGNSSTRLLTFTVTLSKVATSAVSVAYATADGTATAGSDYTAKTGTVSFTAGQTSKTINVTIRGDTNVEPDESFFVNLSNPTNATIDDGQGVGTISNDDQASGATLSIADASTTEGNSGTKILTFTVTLSAAAASNVTVAWATADGTATAGPDYASGSGLVTFTPGQTSRTLGVTVRGDTEVEADETFFVNLSNPTNATISDGQAIGTITSDDQAASSLSINDTSLVEGNSGTRTATFTVTLSPAATGSVTVSYATADGTATAGSDYTAKSASLTFTAGQTSKTVTVTVAGDVAIEPDETFFVNLSNVTGNATITDAQGIGTITNDDQQTVPVLAVNDVSIIEGNSGTKTLTFTVTATPTPTGQATVDFATGSSSASSGTDFVAASGQLAFAAGAATRTIAVTINGDTTYEADETFTVNLSNAAGATITDAQGIGTITNDDSPPALSVGDVSGNEGNSGTTTLVFTITLSPASAVLARVNFATTDGTATDADNDYEPTSGTLEFQPGQTSKTVSVTVNGDTKDEASETFALTLSSPQSATISDDTGTGTINNDDSSVVVQLIPNPLGLLTRQVGTMTVNLSAPAPAGGYTVQLASSDATVATVPTSVTVLQGQQNANFNVTSLNKAGQTTITAQRNSSTVATATVNVSLRKLTVQLVSAYVAAGGSVAGTVTLENPAPASGATVQLSSNATGVATVTPTSLAFAEGETVKNFTVNGLAVGAASITASAAGFESGSRSITVTNNIVSFSSASLTVGQNLQEPATMRIAGTAPAGGIQVRVTSGTPNVLLSTSKVQAGQQSLDLLIPQASSTSGTFYVQVLASTGTAQLAVQVLNTPDPPYAAGTPATVNMVPSGFELLCSGTDCGGVVSNNYTLSTSTQAAPTLMYIQAWALNPAVTVNNRLQTQDVRGGYTINLPLTLTNAALGEFRARVSNQPGTVITQLPIPGGEYFTYFYFDPNNSGSGGNGTIAFTKPAGAGTPLVSSQPYLQSIALAVTGTPVEFLYATNYNVGQNLQESNYVQVASGTAPAGGLSLRVSSSSPNVLLSAVETAAGQQTMDITIVAGQSRSPIFYVQSLASTGTAQLTVQVLTSPNPGYGPGAPVTVNMVPSGFELVCSGTDCGGVVSNNYTLATSTQASPTLMYIQAWALNPAVTVNNRLQTQDVRGGYTINLPLTLTNAALGEFRARVSNQPGNVITQLPIVAGEYYTYFYFDPNNSGSGGNGTIAFTKPAGAGTPLVSSLPYLQSIALAVTGTPVEFLYATNYNVGQNLQEPNYVQIASGTAPAGGLSLRVSSSSPNVLLSAVETAAGQQTMDITIVAGQSRSPIFYVQSLASTGTAQLTVQILTSPNPGYLPGPAVTVNLVPSGFEVISTLGSVVSNQYQLTTTAQATPTLMYIQAWALNPSAVANNRLQTQDVRGGYTINLPLSITNASIGELRNRVSNQPGNVITQLPIVAGEYYTYFYFDPSTAGTGTLNYTKPAGSGTPTVSGLPYLQSVAITVSP